MHRQIALCVSGIVVLTAMIGCSSEDPDSSIEVTEVITEQIGEISPLTRREEIYLGGQPSPEDLALLRDEGFRTIISLRKADEIDWDESEAVEALGMRYIHLPFASPSELTDELFDRVLESLNDAEPGKKLLHCGSSNRVGAIWYAHRCLNDGLSSMEAHQEAKKVGLRSSNLLEAAKAYVNKKNAE